MGQVYVNYDITFHIPQPGNMYQVELASNSYVSDLTT